MKFARTVTKREKKEASKKRLGVSLVFFGLLSLNFILIYSAFFEKPKPIVSPMSKNQTSSSQVVEKKIRESGIRYTSFSTEKDLSYKIILESKGEVIIDSHKDIDEQLSSLQLILKQLKIEGKALKRLDFRYQKPIITF
jgi:hypothetical protein